ncbi:MAG: hypothetical protein GY888_24280 [Planctomycetaceae bacterium]|nr:hypothetical protein [Planctomycetaceae bacterium]
MQGESEDVASKVGFGEVDLAELSDAERQLLRFAKLITERASSCTAAEVQLLRDGGWSDEQIAEAVYVIAMFAFFNRVADAFGLTSQRFDDSQ